LIIVVLILTAYNVST